MRLIFVDISVWWPLSDFALAALPGVRPQLTCWCLSPPNQSNRICIFEAVFRRPRMKRWDGTTCEAAANASQVFNHVIIQILILFSTSLKYLEPHFSSLGNPRQTSKHVSFSAIRHSGLRCHRLHGQAHSRTHHDSIAYGSKMGYCGAFGEQIGGCCC
jgi:hypothetical protein